MEFRVLPYKLSSESSKLLAESLGGLRINPAKTTYRKSINHKLVNWGCSHSHYEGLFELGRDFNHPSSVALAADKRVAYQLFKAWGVPTVEWTENRAIAEHWLQEGYYVYGRDTASGHSGFGITVYQHGQPINTHLFYTKGVSNRHEYRIHVGRRRVIDVTQKKRKNGHADADSHIRSFDNGWVFCRNNIRQPPTELLQVAMDSVHYLDLDFGAVDVCIGSDGVPTVFEVNTAPGIEGTTLAKYTQFFKDCE